MLDALFHTYVGRVVAFVLTPILTVASGSVAVWANKHLGLTLNGGQLTGYVVACVVGVSLVVYKWLSNLGAFERIEAEIVKAHDAGAANS